MSVRAFELVPAIERVKLMSDKAKTQLECVECCGKNLYIGTSDCFVVHYTLEEKVHANGRVTFNSEKQGHKYLGIKKPIAQLKAASALNRIMVLCDNMLTLLNMFDLEPILSGAKIKSVTAFSINENPVHGDPFSVEVCVALKKKMLQIYTVTEDRMTLLRDIPMPDIPISMVLDNIHICVAMPANYNIVNVETGQIQDLFPYDSDSTRSLIKSISKEEYLLSAPNALGVFVTTAGISQRPPLQWSDRLIAISFVHPYILALNDEFITVHSILDQQQKQTIPFQGGKFLGDFDGKIFVASNKEIYALIPVAIEKQIQALLGDKRVTEALDLARNARKVGLSKDKFLRMYMRIQQQAGFIHFANLEFDEARQLFRSGHLDVRELITLYPLLLPTNSNFTRSVPYLHDLADINQLARGNQDTIRELKHFLRTYLEEIRLTTDASGYKLETDTALIKLYAETDSPELMSLLVSDCACDVTDSVQILSKFQRFHALGLLYKFHAENDKALDIWTRIVNGELKDDNFPGIDFIVEFLANLSNHSLVWKYVEWVLQRDQDKAVKIFTERPSGELSSEQMRPDAIVDLLARYPSAVVVYLEYLVFQRKLEKISSVEKEKYHTHLAVLYLDNVLQLMKKSDVSKQAVDIARSKLRHMLQMSDLYRVQLLLGKVKETDMHAESAILYGKLDEHDKALRILVHKLRDYGAAENYCAVNSHGKDATDRKRLFQILLAVYLDPNNEKRDTLIAPAIALLNNNLEDFDAVKVLQIIPENWSVGVLSQFLSSTVRFSMHSARTQRVQRMLARGENLMLKKATVDIHKKCVTMNEERLCAVCQRGFSETTFVRYPNGVLTHVHCAKNKNICPATGKIFSTKTQTS